VRIFQLHIVTGVPSNPFPISPARNYVSTPAATYAAASPVVNYTSTASTLATTQASTCTSVPTSTSTAAATTHTGIFVSEEQYHYALTNFVRTNIYPKAHYISTHWPSDSPMSCWSRTFWKIVRRLFPRVVSYSYSVGMYL
jgi:hypothetical protein